MPLPQLEAWLTRRDKALEARAFVLEAERDLREAETDAKAAREKLTTALAAAGVVHEADASLEELLAAAQVAADREVELKALRDAIVDRQRDLKNRQRDGEKAAAADQAWAASWAKACSACWLGEGGTAPPLASVREILSAVADLGPALEKQAGFADRIGKMENDQAAFAVEVAAIAHELNLDPTVGPVLDLAQTINDLVQNAKAAQLSHAQKMEGLENARLRQRKLAESLAIHARRKAEMTTFFGSGSLADVAGKLQSIKKKADLQEQANEAIRDILEALRLPTMDEAERALDTADRAAFENEFAELKARFDDQDQRSRDLFSAHSKAVDRIEAVGGDDAVARIEEQRRTTLLDIEDKGDAPLEATGRRRRHRTGVARLSRPTSQLHDGASLGSLQDDQPRSLHGTCHPAREGERNPDRARRRWRLEGLLRIVQGHALPALSGASRSRLSRIRPIAPVAAIHRRRYHGDVRRLPGGGGVSAFRGDGGGGPGDIPHPSPASLRNRATDLSQRANS